ncbi:proline racemase family protein [Pseudoalteromonas sp. M8]|uniref:proline racemase family protein n=1 Tax=Pseudoalteromonas sp. M8 TaxID=2692624 RepID=UPI001BAD8AD4|nr:proline racemase family protein [Pseudoalteromonas sp. M8]QUI72773.1 proline racemase [Pseudoalteromonas sp. M8]
MTLTIDFEQILSHAEVIETVDMHTAGEPLRVIVDGFPEPQGNTILDKRQYCVENLDHYRTALMYEPRGHADMYGALIVEKQLPESDFGVLFLHNEGYSTMCGHAIIALATLFLQHNPAKKQLLIDTPAGLITAWLRDGQAEFANVPAEVVTLDKQVKTSEFGLISVDIAFGGAFYAYIDADTIDLALTSENAAYIQQLGLTLKQEIATQISLVHDDARLAFLYGVIFYSNSQKSDSAHSKHVCIFADGELDRSPTGTGVSGRAAILAARNELAANQRIFIEGILGLGLDFCYQLSDDSKSLIPIVSGVAYITGRHQFILDDHDPLVRGFLLR